MKKYLEVIVDIKSNYANRPYTYINGFDQEVQIGERIQIPFGKKDNLRRAYVIGFRDQAPESLSDQDLKVASQREGLVRLKPEAVATAKWLSGQTVSRLVDCIRLFVPEFIGKTGRRKKKLKESSSKDDLQSLAQPGSQGDSASPSQADFVAKPIELTFEQKIAFDMMRADNRPSLLHGVTAGGKTEVYLMMANETVKQGKQVIMLVPEIALTGQMIGRFKEQFGQDRIAILHSRRRPAQRKEDWYRIYEGEVDVVIGPMSAAFSPTPNLGLIIVDEEHESSYKSEQQPRYETGELAIHRGIFSGAKVVLGSATPSVDRYYKAKQGQLQLIEISERYASVMPQVDVVDMKEELVQGRRGVLSLALRTAISETLDKGRQVILFLNRRGYARSVTCRDCGQTIMCDSCGIPMTYHQTGNFLLCHQCERKRPNPKVCPNCGSQRIKYFSPGTEQVEEEVRSMFSDYKIARLDSDVMAQGLDPVEILEEFGRGEIDILLGTQMVAKGLDFSNVALMGIVAIDYEINYPDFRAAERGFDHIVQAAGRAGRREERGRVIVQTYQPECDSVYYGVRNDYKGFYEKEIQRRRFLSYPPFSDLVEMDVRAAKQGQLNDGVMDVDRRIGQILPDQARMFMLERVLNNPPANKVKKLTYRVDSETMPLFIDFLGKMKMDMAEESKPYYFVVDRYPI